LPAHQVADRGSASGCGQRFSEESSSMATTISEGTSVVESTTSAVIQDTTAKGLTKIALLLPGVLGDKSFFDSAQRGMDMIKEKYGDAVEVKVVEMGQDSTRYLPTLYDFSDEGWNVIITGTWLMPDQVSEVAPKYKDINYVLFDVAVDYTNGDFGNVYSILYKANESAFLGGLLAAYVTTDDKMKLSNADKKIGFLGGSDVPGINDFLVGYIQGAKYAVPDIKVNTSYIGSFIDAAKGKEMALAQYNSGVDISFNVAGPAGLGMIDAASDVQRYVIGVDSDQALLFDESNPEKANLIVTSVMKNVDKTLLRAIDLYFSGNLPVGSAETLGLKEEGVCLAYNKYYDKLVSDEIKGKIDDALAKIISGEIVVDTAYGKTTEEMDEIKTSVE